MRCFPGRTLVRLLSFELAFSAVAGLPAQTLPPRHQRHGYRSLGAVVSKVAVEVVNTAARLFLPSGHVLSRKRRRNSPVSLSTEH